MTDAGQPDTLSFKEFADYLGFRPSYITALKKDGRLVLTDDGKRVRVAESVARIEATRNPARADVAQRHAEARTPAEVAPDPSPVQQAAAGAEKIGNTYQAARAVKERYLAMSAKRDYEVAIGKLLPADEVRSAIANAASVIRTELENLPDSIAPILAAETDEARVRLLLADEIEAALGNLAARFDKIAKETPA
ncbi:hypothetical protein [Thauera sp.]|uniref:hypothetical protein n=1 Tax=Thauera sp. TaxID=1905334 RepID=UPI0039E5645B